jgi:hypothetical protein
MRPVGQIGWPVLIFCTTACSLLLDFDRVPKEQANSPVQVDGGVDAGQGGPSCDLATHQGCDSDQLCCDRSDARGPSCGDTLGARECTACGRPCGDSTAPHCGAGRTCECELGSGQACAPGKRCVGPAGAARCAECESDDDCSAQAGRKQCVANVCVECDRGAMIDNAADDQGCNEAARPICNVRNQCAGCSNNPDDCPGDQVCNGMFGCFGCDLLHPLDTKNCGGTRPICRAASNGQPQCDACRTDSECGGGYCDSRPGVGTGACTAVCAPAKPLGMNGCATATPFCKQVAGNEFGCRACTAADCSGATPHCAIDAGPRRGSCVVCRSNADCSQSAAPVCDAASATCRPRQASDCPAGSVFDPASRTCIECMDATDCADTPATPVCVGNSCVQCEVDTQCSSDGAPFCSTATHSCVACTSLNDQTAADARCAAKGTDAVCVTRGNYSGQCGACDPRNNRGCAAPMPFCFGLNNRNNNPPVCHECDPDDNMQTCNNGNCGQVEGIYSCVTNN